MFAQDILLDAVKSAGLKASIRSSSRCTLVETARVRAPEECAQINLSFVNI